MHPDRPLGRLVEPVGLLFGGRAARPGSLGGAACLEAPDTPALRGARLVRADVAYADLCGADLRGADLRARLGGANLQGARYDETTRWPSSFHPAQHGAVTATEAVPAPLPHGRGDEPSVCQIG